MLLQRFIILSLGAAAAVPAAAQTADQDVRCMLVGNAFGQSEKDPKKKQVAALTSLYFSGRADARLTPAQLKTAIQAQAKALNAQNAGPAMNACVQSFQTKQQTLQNIVKQLAQARPKK